MKYILIVLMCLMISCTAGTDANHDKERGEATVRDLEEVCIGGHTYYIYTSRYQVGPALALKVNDNGLPILCEKE